MKLLLDINVILDVLQGRKPHYESAARVLSLCAEGDIEGYLSALSYGTIHYLLSQELGRAKSLKALRKLRAITDVAAVDEKVIDLALDSGFSDLEDALQYYAAVNQGITHIITRNKKDFAKADLVIATPEEFLAMTEK